MFLDEKEVLRYLGFRGNEPDAGTRSLVKSVGDSLLKVVSPKNVWRKYSAEFSQSDVLIDGILIKSKSLFQHLSGCNSVYFFAATLGSEADTFLRRLSMTDMAAAVIAQACCAALIESYCDDVQNEIARIENSDGLFLRPRFSPGYGDFNISFQKEIFARLQPEKYIGLTLTEMFLMVPMKSVSAIIGVSDNPGIKFKKCDNCENSECSFCEKN